MIEPAPYLMGVVLSIFERDFWVTSKRSGVKKSQIAVVEVELQKMGHTPLKYPPSCLFLKI